MHSSAGSAPVVSVVVSDAYPFSAPSFEIQGKRLVEVVAVSFASAFEAD